VRANRFVVNIARRAAGANRLDKAAGLKQVFIFCHGSTGSIASTA
jgi:hypothetical protein